MTPGYNSELLDRAVGELSKLPGIGRKTALRLALHLLRREPQESVALGEAIIEMRRNIRYCRKCHNISGKEVCEICADTRRDPAVVCVVESVQDVLSIEATGEHRGVYHVLGGLISPTEGIGPADIEIDSLTERVGGGGIREVILALSPTIEGDTTNFYLYRKLEPLGVEVSVLARGISIGNDIEYTDEITLGSSLHNRIPFSQTFKR